MKQIEEINKTFNDDLLKQIEGLLLKHHTYNLGTPSAILQSAQIPDLPIELRASRLREKAMQETHPFDLCEIMDLPEAIRSPLAIFRSATHLGHYVIMTELKHHEDNFVVVLQINREKNNDEINDIRSIYPKNSKQITNWINESLLEFIDKAKMAEWLSKQRSNSAEVRKQFNHVAKVIQNFNKQ